MPNIKVKGLAIYKKGLLGTKKVYVNTMEERKNHVPFSQGYPRSFDFQRPQTDQIIVSYPADKTKSLDKDQIQAQVFLYVDTRDLIGNPLEDQEIIINLNKDYDGKKLGPIL